MEKIATCHSSVCPQPWYSGANPDEVDLDEILVGQRFKPDCRRYPKGRQIYTDEFVMVDIGTITQNAHQE